MLHQYYVLDRYFLYTIYIYMHAIPLTNLLFLEKSDQSPQYSYNASAPSPLPKKKEKIPRSMKGVSIEKMTRKWQLILVIFSSYFGTSLRQLLLSFYTTYGR